MICMITEYSSSLVVDRVAFGSLPPSPVCVLDTIVVRSNILYIHFYAYHIISCCDSAAVLRVYHRLNAYHIILYVIYGVHTI